MSIDFKCPSTGISSSFPDAYAGVKYRCKHCTEFHSLPHAENYVHKDILAACPSTNEVVSIDSSFKTNRFQCAACGDIHEVPGETNTNTTEIASSTKYQNQSRQKIIPSVRKKSLILAESEAKLKTVSQSDLKAINIPEKKSGNQTERKSLTQTERKRLNSNTPFQDGSNRNNSDKARTPKQPRRKSSSANYLILILLVVLIFGAWFLINTSKETISDISSLNEKLILANNQLNLGNFDKAIELTDQILISILNNKKLMEKINYQEIELKNKQYKDQKAIFLAIEKEFTNDLNNPNITQSGIEKSLLRINEAHLKIPPEFKNTAPILAALKVTKTALYKKHAELTKQLINKKISKAEDLFQAGDYHESIYRIQNINKLIEEQNIENQKLLKSEFDKRLNYFESAQKSYANINDIYAKVESSPLLINQIESELKDINNSFGEKDFILKNLIDQKLILLNEQKKIMEVRKIDNLLKDKNEVKKELLAYLNTLTPNDYVVKQEVIKHISRVSANIRELPSFQQTSIEILTNTATLIGEALIKNDTSLKIKIDTDKSKISLQDNNLQYAAGYIEIATQPYFLFDINGIKIAIEKNLFETNIIYFTKYAKFMHDSLLMYGGEQTFSQNHWRITADLMRIGAPAAFQKNENGETLFLNNIVYNLKSVNSFFSNELTLKQDLQTQINKTKSILKNSPEFLDVKSNLYYLLEKLYPNEKINLNQFAPNKNWLVNNSYLGLLKDPVCIKSFTELNELWVQSFEKQHLWLTGESDNKSILQISRINGNRVYGSIYNPDKIETTFISTVADPIDLIYQDISLQFCFFNVYQGNHATQPNQSPLRTFTVHPLVGIVNVFDYIANSFESNDKIWKIAIESSKLFGEKGVTSSTLPAHTLRIDKSGNIQEIYSQNFTLNLEKIQSGSANSFDNWIHENKKKLASPAELNLLLLYVNDPFHLEEQRFNFSNHSPNTDNYILQIKKGKFIGSKGAISRQINTIISATGIPNIILNVDNSFCNLWLEHKLEKQFICFLNQGFINKVSIEDFIKDLKSCLLNKSHKFYSPYNIPIAFFDNKLNAWTSNNVSGLVISDLLSEEIRLEVLETINAGSQNAYLDLLNNSTAKNLNELDLLTYLALESQGNYSLANEKFAKGIKAIKKENTIVANIEKIRLMKYLNKEKEIDQAYSEIFKNIVANEIFKKDPDKIKDVRFHLAKEFSEIGKINSAIALLNSPNPTKIYSNEEIQVYADICYAAYNLFDKNKLTATEFKAEIEPIQMQLEKSFQYITEESPIDIYSLLKLNLAWVKSQTSKDGVDATTQQLLDPPKKSEKLAINGKELLLQQWNWIKQNPLCYDLIINRLFHNIESDNEVDAKQKINIAIKIIKAMNRNIVTEEPLWRIHPFQFKIDELLFFENLCESKWQVAAEKLKNLMQFINQDETTYRYLSIATMGMKQNEMETFLNACIKLELPDHFYRKFYFSLQSLKFIKKSKALSDFLKDKLPENKNLILDITKEN